jgi:hypothetical protein
VVRRALLVGVVLVLGAVLALLMWRAQRGGGDTGTPANFSQDGVAVEARDLDVEVLQVAGEVVGQQTRWRCRLVCRESEGCHAQLRIQIHYRSGSEGHELSFVDTVSVASGEEMVVVGFQRPPRVVDEVERVDLFVEQRLEPDQPTPPPFM